MMPIFSVSVLEGLSQLEDAFRWLINIALEYGYLGIFLSSFIGSLSIVVPIPYTALIFMLGAWLDPIPLALSASAGAALGELPGYLIGYYGGSLVSEDRRRRIKRLAEILNKYGAPIIFVFALTPLPDDLLFIPLGVMRYPITKAFMFCLIGKMAMSFILAYGGRFSIGVIKALIGGEHAGFVSAIITLVLLVAALIIMFKVDWEKYLEKYLR